MDNVELVIPLVAIMIPIVAIIGAFAFIITRTLAKSRVRELEVRERIAMIERGLVPAPEVDPRGFERAMASQQRSGSAKSAVRHRRLGITLMGVGFGLMVMIGFAGQNPADGIGVGGFLVVIGIAFFVNSLFDLRHAADESTANGGSSNPVVTRSSSDTVPPR